MARPTSFASWHEEVLDATDKKAALMELNCSLFSVGELSVLLTANSGSKTGCARIRDLYKEKFNESK